MRKVLLSFLLMMFLLPVSAQEKRGFVVTVSDLVSLGLDGWEKRIKESGINLIGVHAATFHEPLDSLRSFMTGPMGRQFLDMCSENNVDVEYEMHILEHLLPRELFESHPEYFRQGKSGNRQPRYNMCFTCDEAYDAIRSNLKDVIGWMHPTTHRYFLWPDDVKGTYCYCEKCRQYSPSEQALLYENRILGMLREFDPDATLAHLSYYETLEPPMKVKPDPGVFYEFAPILRDYSEPLPADMERDLRANLEIFPASTAHILEYWLDESMFCKWKPAALVELPFNEQECRRDINLYRNLGVYSITTFTSLLSQPYADNFGSVDWAFEGYGRAFSNGKSSEHIKISRCTKALRGLHAPWSGQDDGTVLKIHRDADSLYFRFEVKEASMTVQDRIDSEMDIEPEDRVELFFSPTENMTVPYYGIEIDPCGRKLDYKTDYYRKFDYGWEFPVGSIVAVRSPAGYAVDVSFSKKDLRKLGIGKRFWLGIFRADFHPDGSMVWYSRRPSGDTVADFHKPDMLIPVTL